MLKNYKIAGIGPYTSATIASISFGESIVAIDEITSGDISSIFS